MHDDRLAGWPWFPRYSLTSLLLAALVVNVFLGEFFGIDQLHYKLFEPLLVVLAVVHALSPIALWWLPKNLRWTVWMLVYLGIFVGAQHGINYFQGVLMCLGSLAGASTGLLVNQMRDRTAAAASGTRPRYVWAFFGCCAGLVFLMPTVPLLSWATDGLRGEVAGMPGVFRTRQNDREVMMFLGFIYVVLALAVLRAYLVVSQVGWWKGFWMGGFVFATAVGVLSFCFH